MKIFIDDERFPPDDNSEWTIVRSFEEAVEKTLNKQISFVSFDHDLGVGKSGFDFCKWLVETDMDQSGQFLANDFDFFVHSMNPVGRENIKNYMEQYLKIKRQTT